MNNNLKPVNTIAPFRRFCMTIGELPSSYLETMTYYEMLVWFTKFLSETVIPTVNNNAEAVKELQDLYIALKSYVDNYFDNLDLQEEVDNKLDEMVEDGSLGEVVMAALNNKVDTITMNDNTGITITKYQKTTDGNTTTYYITKIPYLDKNNQPNELKQGLANNRLEANNTQTAREFSIDNGCKLVINCGIFNTTSKLPISKVLIQNSVALSGQVTDTVKDVIAIKNDGTLKSYVNDASLTANALIEDGVKYCCTGFFTLVENGESVYNPAAEEIINPLYYQRQIISQAANKDIYILTCDGKNFRENINQGLSIAECVQILSYFNITYAYMLDGGGSTSLVYNNVFINQPTDDHFTNERSIPIYFYVSDNAPAEIKNVEKVMGDIKKEVDEIKGNDIYNQEIRDNEVRWFEQGTQPTLGWRMYWSDLSNKLQIKKKGVCYYNYDDNEKILDIDKDYANEMYYMYNKERYAPRNKVEYKSSIVDIDNINYSCEFFIYSDYALDSGLPTANDYWFISRKLSNVVDGEAQTTNAYYVQVCIPRSETIKPKFRWSYNNVNWTSWSSFA